MPAAGEAHIAAMNSTMYDSSNIFASSNVVGITRSKTKLDLPKTYVFPAHAVTGITVEHR